MPKNYLYPIFSEALKKIAPAANPNLFFETPKNPEHGDLTTNVAMTLSKELKANPRQIAQSLIDSIDVSNSFIEKIEIAGPGFINIKLTNSYYFDKLKSVLWAGSSFGKLDFGVGKKVNVEYVSVNPTGLLHLGHGRNAVIGDTVANLLSYCGYSVVREYYFNNAGGQMIKLADSVFARYKQITEPNFPFPEDGYHGEYIKEIANELLEEYGDELEEKVANLVNSGSPKDAVTKVCKDFGEKWCFAKIKETLVRLNTKQDVYYNEDSLYNEGKIENLLTELTAKNLVYEKEGAKWLKFSEIGLQEDRVIVRSNGEPTYRLPDIAYHREKILRGFDIIIDVFGADHIATIPDVIAALKALGYDADKIKVLIYQFVTLTENGEQVKMSKRTGKSYTLDELLDEVGADVVRFFLLMRGISTHLEFDLALAREQSDKNPVFYLQYAHARICSIFNTAKERGYTYEPAKADLSLLNNESELALIKKIVNFESIIERAALNFEPQTLAEYLRETASSLHLFYHECRILGESEELMQARLGLAHAASIVLKNGLNILGISTPEKM